MRILKALVMPYILSTLQATKGEVLASDETHTETELKAHKSLKSCESKNKTSTCNSNTIKCCFVFNFSHSKIN